MRLGLGICLVAFAALTAGAAQQQAPTWEKVHLTKETMTVDQTKTFMKRLAEFVFDNHLKKDPQLQQCGMVYEYLDVKRSGHFDQFVQGEALDTMHDGAWFAAALVNAWRTTGDPFYKELPRDCVLPFYLKMLNHSDALFTTQRAVVRQGAAPWGKPWAFQEGEKGFIPYWWDDGGSVSLERRGDKDPLPIRRHRRPPTGYGCSWASISTVARPASGPRHGSIHPRRHTNAVPLLH